MPGTVYSGNYPNGIVLNNLATQEAVTITGTVSNPVGDAVLGTTLFPWTVNNQGTIEATGTAGAGVALLQGGTVNNQTLKALIEGYDGVLIKGAAGLVTNLGTIAATGSAGSNSRGVFLTEGGKVVNGSTADTAALIAGVRNAILIEGSVGTVANFGTISNSGTHATINLFEGGTVTNGASASTAALITGAGTGVYFKYAGGVVTNFGNIVGSTGVSLHDGGTVNNGMPGSTAATITGTSGNGVTIRGTAGVVNNFGTVDATGVNSGVSMIDGGRVVNGSAAVYKALITAANGPGIYFSDHAPGAITNFGTIEATSTGQHSGIVMERGGNVLNEGTITSASMSAAGVYLRGGGTVTNTKNGAIVGLISGAGTGVSFRGGAGTLTNSGSVVGAASSGVYFGAGGSLVNLSGGLIEGHIDGVYNRGIAIAVTNAGMVKSTGTLDGIYLRGGGSVTNNRGGTIAGGGAGIALGQQGATVTNAGLITGIVGVDNGSSGSLTLTNSGTISSTSGTAGVAVQLGNSVGKDLLIVETGAVFVGAVNGGGNGEVEFVPGGVATVTAMSGFATIELGNGLNHSLTLTDANFAGVNFDHITVIGASNASTVNIVNTVSASAVTLGPVIFVGGGATGTGTITDHFTGGASNDIFQFSATNLTSADTVNGNGGFDNELLMTSPGAVAATGVTGVEIYELASGGANSLSLANGNFTGVATHGGFIRVYGGNSGNTINAAGVTTATDQVVMYGGAGTDTLTGGAGNDVFVFTAATLTAAGDTVAGGGGANELLMTTAGTVHAGGVSGVESYALASGASNILSLGTANFGGIVSGRITVYDGNNGNSVSAPTLSSSEAITVYAGSGADVLTGGAGNDVFVAGGNTSMTGGAGANRFEFLSSAAATNKIVDFATSGTNGLVFSNTAFALGFTGATAVPKLWTSTSEFVADGATGFTSGSQRLWYDSGNGDLSFSASGTNATAHLIASLSTGLSINAATQLFFVT